MVRLASELVIEFCKRFYGALCCRKQYPRDSIRQFSLLTRISHEPNPDRKGGAGLRMISQSLRIELT